ncbi:MAG: TlpA family protein disulfide reductase [Elusimicrobia bacterium]|nr:TlpA family protein disulfide reductase [Elusimicrobiota bacterium]
MEVALRDEAWGGEDLMRIPMWLWRLVWLIRSGWQKDLDVGNLFPPFRLKDLGGRPHAVPDRTGHSWTILWFTNLCEDCRGKAPLLEELRREAGDRFRILAVSLLGHDEALPRQVAASCGLTILLDPHDIVARKLRLPHPPQTCPFRNLFILDRDGKILFKHHLSAMKPEAFRSLWQGYLLSTPP